MIYNRFKYNGIYLKETDFTKTGGFGFDTDHYIRVLQARKSLNSKGVLNKFGEKYKTSKDYSEKWDHRDGYYITGEKIIRNLHFLHNYDILDVEENEMLIIDNITMQHFRGKYLTMGLRDNKRSHRMVNYMNYTSHDPELEEDIIENQKKYQLVRKNDKFKVIATKAQLEDIGVSEDLMGEEVTFDKFSIENDLVFVTHHKTILGDINIPTTYAIPYTFLEMTYDCHGKITTNEKVS